VGETLLARSELLSEQLSMTLTELDSAKDQPSGDFKVSVPHFLNRYCDSCIETTQCRVSKADP